MPFSPDLGVLTNAQAGRCPNRPPRG